MIFITRISKARLQEFRYFLLTYGILKRNVRKEELNALEIFRILRPPFWKNDTCENMVTFLATESINEGVGGWGIYCK